MARIVDETYIEDLCSWIKGCEDHYEIALSRILTEVKEDLENMPEVVQCKDCKYSEWDCDCGLYLCLHHGCDWNEGDHFCSYGERKDHAKEQTSQSL